MSVWAPVGAASATLAVVYVAWAIDGVGNYHINQFRVYFTVSDGVQPKASGLIEVVRSGFEDLFEGNLASVSEVTVPSETSIAVGVRSGQVEQLNDTASRESLSQIDLKEFTQIRIGHIYAFEMRSRLLKSLRAAADLRLPGGHSPDGRPISHPVHRDVVLLADPGGAHSFSAKTLQRAHFLAGTRSWAIAPAGAEIPLVHESEPSPIEPSERTFFLETAAFERYQFGRFRLTPPWTIKKVWRSFLVTAIVQCNWNPTSAEKPTPDGEIPTTGGDGFGRDDWMKKMKKMKKEKKEKKEKKVSIQIWERSMELKPVSVSESKKMYSPRLDGPDMNRLWNLHPDLKSEYLSASGDSLPKPI